MAFDLDDETSIDDLHAVFQDCGPEHIGDLLSSRNYSAFKNASFHGKVEMVQAMLDVCPLDQRFAMNAASYYSAFVKQELRCGLHT